ncbi:MAG TPA: VTT domain-containing protein [Candidatus Paceibacterota bacterium]
MLDFFDIPYLLITFGYTGIFVIIFLESGIFFPLPGDSLLFTGGLFAATIGLNIYFLLVVVFVATFLGGLAGYQVGVYLYKLHDYSFFRIFLKKEHIDRAHIFFEKHGQFAIMFCRFIPIIRTFTPIVAGVAKMNYREFVKYNTYGSLIWTLLITLLGFFLGHVFPEIQNHLSWIIVLIVLISFLPFLLKLRPKRRAK